MISCERAQTLFGPGWDDELSVVERESLEQHFAGCNPCRRDYDEFARTLELVQGLPRPQVSGDFATRVLAEARRREAEGGRGLLITRGWFAHPARLAIAAALVVAAGVSGLMMSPKPQAPRVATQQVAAPAPVVATPAPIVTPPSTSGLGGPGFPRAVRREAHARATRAQPARRGRRRGARQPVDNLFDHTADVELVLDPVTLRKERGRGYTPVQTTVKGEQASITF